ncbi:keratin-associated protein 4-4-like isoform X2 [Mizuhopecten yessoensis]|uniref:keratin-associated protein 4-4-like isoform X2 n=1 Tax=Mizuhopecten yessoensis TaxID=6573 RepID=UPI000B45F0B9|nr:keratin-associated protein 4-4-like isoform X2 [Mizuhopecten yessoensis]
MANMYLTCLVSVLTLTVVQCAGLDCSPSTCTAPKTCQWTCKKTTALVVGANVAACTAVDGTCGNATVTDGQCKHECQTPTVKLTCSPSCSAPKTCHWTCKKTTAVVVGADLTTCKAADNTCGNTTVTDGQCKSECRTPAGKNGSIRLGVSPLMLLCGIFTKLFL